MVGSSLLRTASKDSRSTATVSLALPRSWSLTVTVMLWPTLGTSTGTQTSVSHSGCCDFMMRVFAL